MLSKQIVKLHAKEFSRAKMNDEGLWKGFEVDLLDGDIDWEKVMKSLREVDYQGGWMTIELGGGDRTQLKKYSEQMDRILAL